MLQRASRGGASFAKHNGRSLLLSAAVVALSGCGFVRVAVTPPSTTPTPTPTPAPVTPGTMVYVLQQGDVFASSPGTSYVLTFSGTATGSTTPLASLTLPAGFDPYSLALDSAGETYVGGFLKTANSTTLQNQILLYSAGATGAASPLRSFFIQTGLPISMSVDSAGELYVAAASSSSLAVFAANTNAGGNGVGTPVRLIQGAQTGLNAVTDVAVDGPGNAYITSGSALLVFASGADGNVAPNRTITNSGEFFYGVDVDAGGTLYVAQQGPGGQTVAVFPAGSNGATTPAETLQVGPGHSLLGGLRRDRSGDLFLVDATTGSGSVSYSLESFGAGVANGSTPSAQVTSGSWTAAATEVAVK